MDVFYTRDDDWIAVDGDVATVGITEFARSRLGEILFVQLPQTGTVLVRGGEAALIESIKAVSDLFSPVTGRVVALNRALGQRPSLLNTAPEAEGWLFRLELADPAELTGLLSRAAYLARVRLM